MSLIPFRGADKFFGDEDFFFPVFSKERSEPDVDIYEMDGEVVAEVNLPGVDAEKLDVSVRDNILHVSGGKEEETEDEGKGYWKKEIRKGSFSRSVRIPVPVEGEKSDASYENGILKVIMPKKKETKEGKLKVRVK